MQEIQANVEELIHAAHKGQHVLLVIDAHHKVIIHLVRDSSHHNAPENCFEIDSN